MRVVVDGDSQIRWKFELELGCEVRRNTVLAQLLQLNVLRLAIGSSLFGEKSFERSASSYNQPP